MKKKLLFFLFVGLLIGSKALEAWWHPHLHKVKVYNYSTCVKAGGRVRKTIPVGHSCHYRFTIYTTLH